MKLQFLNCIKIWIHPNLSLVIGTATATKEDTMSGVVFSPPSFCLLKENILNVRKCQSTGYHIKGRVGNVVEKHFVIFAKSNLIATNIFKGLTVKWNHSGICGRRNTVINNQSLRGLIRLTINSCSPDFLRWASLALHFSGSHPTCREDPSSERNCTRLH